MVHETKRHFQGTMAEFGRKYLWWKPVDGQRHSDKRIIAQTMNLGTYDDILLLEQTVGRARLVEIMLHAEPGWFNEYARRFNLSAGPPSCRMRRERSSFSPKCRPAP